MFKDARFMTAKEKKLVLKSWRTFLRHGLKKQHFTKRLYGHLHLYCGFIANFNLGGFYSTYFEAGQDTERFFEHFWTYTIQNHSVNSDYDDLNTAMREVYDEYREVIMKKTAADIADSLDLLEACVKRSKNDGKFARDFLSKIHI